MVGYGLVPSNELIKALHGDKEAFDNLPDFVYYVSTVDDSYIGDEEVFNNLMQQGIIYYEKMQTKSSKAPQILYAKMVYYVMQYSKNEPLKFIFVPLNEMRIFCPLVILLAIISLEIGFSINLRIFRRRFRAPSPSLRA